MSDLEQTQLLLIKGVLSDFDREVVDNITEHFNNLADSYSKENYGSDKMERIFGLVATKWIIEKSLSEK